MRLRLKEINGFDMSDNAIVASAATRKNGLPLDEMALIGVFGKETARRALIRHASGRIETVRPGERLGGRTVVSIGLDGIVLKSGSRVQRLEMPSG